MGEEEITELEKAKTELISIKQSSLISLGYKEKKAKKLNSLPVLDALIEEYQERKKKSKENELEKNKKTKENGFLQNMPDQFGTDPDKLIDEKPKLRGNKLWNLKPSSAEGQHMVYNKDAATRVHRIHNKYYPEGFVF